MKEKIHAKQVEIQLNDYIAEGKLKAAEVFLNQQSAVDKKPLNNFIQDAHYNLAMRYNQDGKYAAARSWQACCFWSYRKSR